MKQLGLFEPSSGPPTLLGNTNLGPDRARLERKYAGLLYERPELANLVSYIGNKKIPILRLYRYKEAFAYRFVEEWLTRFGLGEQDYVLDPFCGMGTTLFTSFQKSIPSIGLDRLPIAVFVAQTLPLFFSLEPGQVSETFEKLKSKVSLSPPGAIAEDVAIMKIAFPPDNLLLLRRWKSAIDTLPQPSLQRQQFPADGEVRPSPRPRKHCCLEETLQPIMANHIKTQSLKGAQNENH